MSVASFEEIMARADDEALRDLVGPTVTRLLLRLDPDLAKPSNLRTLLLQLRSASEMIRDPGSRRTIVEMLPRELALNLAAELGLDHSDPAAAYAGLSAFRLRKGSAQEDTFHRLLGASVDDEAPDTSPVPTSDVTPDYPLFGHQRTAAARVREAITTGRRRVVLHMPTGSGKTRTAMNVICDYLRDGEPRLAIWLAYNEELCEQAASEFDIAWKSIGNRTIQTFRFWGSNPIDVDHVRDGLVVCGLDKMRSSIQANYRTWSRLADRSRLVVIDEAHQALAPTYRDTLELLVERHPETGLLGLTATPGRTWDDLDEDRKLSNIFANRKVTLAVEGYMNPVDYLVDEGYLARTTFEPLSYAGGMSLSERDLEDLEEAIDIPASILSRLADDDARNLLILSKVESLVRSHRRVIVFATTAQHANTLAAVLTARGIRAASVTSKTPSSERRRRITAFRSNDPAPRVLCNYGVLTTGFDAPRTSAAIIARPTKSLVLYSQMVGRATRGVRAGGNQDALVLTVVDTSLPGFGAMSEAFTNWEDVWDD